MDDDLRMLGALLTKPEPDDGVTARGRLRLRTAMHGPDRRRRFTWPIASVAAATAAATATAAIVVSSVVTSDVTPNGPPSAAPAELSARQILLVAAGTAAKRPVGSGTYWHVKTVYSDGRGTHDIETWTRRDGREYSRSGSDPVALIHGWPSAFSMTDTLLTFEQIQRLPADPAALKANLTRMLKARKLPVPADRIVGPGRNPQLIESLISLLARMPAPPKVRAAAFRAIASLPGVTRQGPARGGQTLLIRGDAGDMRLVVDPATSLVRGWSATPPAKPKGAWFANQSVSIPTAEWTSELP